MSTLSGLGRARPFAMRYVRMLGAFFVLQALGGGAVKLAQGRGDDLPHAGLHLVSGMVALWASSPARARSAPSPFAVGFGVLYLMLGVLGQLDAPVVAALHLEAPDHVFHMVAGAATVGIGARQGRVGPGHPEVSPRAP